MTASNLALRGYREQRCPDCTRTRIEERQTPEPCSNRFHDRLPTWKGWTP